MVEVFELGDKKSIQQKIFEQPNMLMKFQTSALKTRFNGANWVAGISGDSHLTIYNADTHKTVFCKPGHEGCSVLNGFVDPTGNFVASIGSDSNINIYKFIND